MPRKTKLTPELISQIETSLQSHTSVVTTCDLVGISQETYYRWLREGEAAKQGLKAEFYDTVKRATAMSKVILVNQISKDPSWQAKAWILERQFPKEFGRRQLIAHAGADGETDLPAGAAGAINLTIKMQRPDEDAPWVFKAEQDEEPANGSNPYESDHHGFDHSESIDPSIVATQPVEPAPPPSNPTPPRGPSLPSRQNAKPPGDDANPARPRDPDDHE